MKKLVCVAASLLACAGALYVAYEAGKESGYKAGLRDAEGKQKCGCGEDCDCECQCHADDVSGLEAEGEAVAPAYDATAAGYSEFAETQTE